MLDTKSNQCCCSQQLQPACYRDSWVLMDIIFTKLAVRALRGGICFAHCVWGNNLLLQRSAYCGKMDWRKFNLEFDPLRAENWSPARRSVSKLTLKVFLRATPKTSSLYTIQRAIRNTCSRQECTPFWGWSCGWDWTIYMLTYLNCAAVKVSFYPQWTTDEEVNTPRKESLEWWESCTVLLRLVFFDSC